MARTDSTSPSTPAAAPTVQDLLDKQQALHARKRELQDTLQATMRAVEADNAKKAAVAKRIEGERARCKALGLDFDPESYPVPLVPYAGDEPLTVTFHALHYQIADADRQIAEAAKALRGN